MFFFDPYFLLFAVPGMLLAAYAQYKVKSAFGKWSQVGTRRGLTGAATAQAILDTKGIRDVRIEQTQGFLSDHYDPTSKTLRLSPDVYGGRSVAAAGVAAHEVGHAIQHAEAYPWLGMRSRLVGPLQVTSKLAPVTIIGGFVLMMVSPALVQTVLLVGVAFMAVLAAFQIVTLPVEFDASNRALEAIHSGNIVTSQEQQGAKEVLDAAALTYVAAAVSTILTMLYYLWRAGLIGGSSDD